MNSHDLMLHRQRVKVYMMRQRAERAFNRGRDNLTYRKRYNGEWIRWTDDQRPQEGFYLVITAESERITIGKWEPGQGWMASPEDRMEGVRWYSPMPPNPDQLSTEAYID